MYNEDMIKRKAGQLEEESAIEAAVGVGGRGEESGMV